MVMGQRPEEETGSSYGCWGGGKIEAHGRLEKPKESFRVPLLPRVWGSTEGPRQGQPRWKKRQSIQCLGLRWLRRGQEGVRNAMSHVSTLTQPHGP